MEIKNKVLNSILTLNINGINMPKKMWYCQIGLKIITSSD